MSRSLRLSAAIALAAAIAVALLLALGSNAGKPQAPRSSDGLVNGFYGSTAPGSIPAIDFSLRDEAGRLVRLRSYAGMPVVLVFIDSTCRRLCPLVAQLLRGTLGELRRPVPVIALSVDPEQDTPARVRSFLGAAELNGRVAYIAGPRAALEPIWRFFGVEPERPAASVGASFSLDIELLDKDGRPRVGYEQLGDLDPDFIAHDIEALAGEPSSRHTPRRLELP